MAALAVPPGAFQERRLVKSFEELGKEYFGPQFSSDKVVEDLAKALATQFVSGTGALTDQPINLQNLDATMTSVLFEEQHLVLFNWLSKVPSAQPYYEWNRRRSYGGGRSAPGFREGGTPKGGVSKYQRFGVYNKYLGVRRGVTHQMTLTGQLGGTQVDPVAEENRNGTLELLEKIERWLMFGDSRILDENGNEVNYDGIIRQMEIQKPDNIIDLQGQPFSFEYIEEAAYKLYQEGKLRNFAGNVQAFMSPFVLSDLSKLKLQAERVMLGIEANRGPFVSGEPLRGYASNFGYVPFEPSVFFEEVDGSRPLKNTTDDPENGGPEPGAPDVPATVTATAGAANPAGSSKMTAGTYYYFASAFNDSGEGLTTASSAVTVAAGQQVTIEIARVTGATGYRIYRGTTSDYKEAGFIATIPQPSSGNAIHVDKNQRIPFTGYVAILERNPADLVIAQMTPLIKFPLAIVSTTIEFLLLLYHVLVVKAPERQVIFKNVGRLQ